jgi:hypothetical protein
VSVPLRGGKSDDWATLGRSQARHSAAKDHPAASPAKPVTEAGPVLVTIAGGSLAAIPTASRC